MRCRKCFRVMNQDDMVHGTCELCLKLENEAYDERCQEAMEDDQKREMLED